MIVAADREGLRAKRLHLYHLRGSSALDYECDIAIIMNNKYQVLSKDHISFNPYQARQYREWVVYTIEKNRAGRAMIDMEFHLHAPYFSFDPRGQMVQQRLGPMGLAGFFCNGEIGPVGERSFLHGYTASLALFVKKTGQ